jgi:hypothetical protein
MATIAPSRRSAVAQSDADGKRLTEALYSWRRRLWVQQMLRWTENGVIAGIIFACILLLISRFIPWATAFYWAIGIAAVSLICASGAAIWYRPSFARSARLVDARLALHDRLSTAWEFHDDSAPISALQRRDALKQLGKHTPATTISLRPGRIRLITFGIVVIALALLLLLPNPMNTVLQQQAAFQDRLARQVAAINQVRTVIDNQKAISAQERALIDQILRETLAQLQKANNEAQAQQILAQAQAKLNQLRDPQAISKAQARTNASTSLQNSSNSNVSAAGKALASGDSKALDSSLQKLASQVNSMTPAQRAQLAQQIEQSANQAHDNPQLSSALHQLAKAVAGGNSSETSDAVKAVEIAAAQDSANQANTNSIDKASQTLQNAANMLASSTDSGNSQNPGQTQTPGQGQNPGQTRSPSQGQGNSGPGGQNNTGNKTGKNEQVYVPGQVGSGTSAISANGSNGTVQSGNPVPYSQVIAQYAQMAHDAIDNSNIPPDLKDLIRGYFNSLEGQQ